MEIAAQHLEKALGVQVNRKVDLGSPSIGYESLLMSSIDVYPEDTNAIAVSVLKDPMDQNPDIVLERVRGEMARLGRVYVFNPLGIHRRMGIVVRASDARDYKIDTIADAARSHLGWTLGPTSEFSRADGRVLGPDEYLQSASGGGPQANAPGITISVTFAESGQHGRRLRHRRSALRARICDAEG